MGRDAGARQATGRTSSLADEAERAAEKARAERNPVLSREAEYLEQAIDRYPPAIAATARAALRRLRTRFPGAHLLAYDRRQSLPIGFAPAAGGGAPFSVVLYPRWVRFFFLEGVALDDPQERLEGAGNQVRSIKLDEAAAVLDDPYIRRLITQAVRLSGADLKTGAAEVVLKSTLRPVD